MCITNGGYADTFIVLARTSSEASRGYSVFVVQKGMPGFRLERKIDKMGLRASDTTELIFEDCEVPAENLIGKEGEGLHAITTALYSGRMPDRVTGDGNVERLLGGGS